MTLVAILYGAIVQLAAFWSDVHIFFAQLFNFS